MPDKDTRHHGTTSKQVIETVASWPYVTTGNGPFDSPAFYVETRQIGHIHLDQLPSVDITYPRPLEKQLLAEEYTNEHPVTTGSDPPNATFFVIESESDIDNAIWLFRLSYLYHTSVLQKREETASDLKEIDIQKELDGLGPSDAIREAFETAVGGSS